MRRFVICVKSCRGTPVDIIPTVFCHLGGIFLLYFLMKMSR